MEPTKEAYRDFLDAVRKETGIAAFSADESGLASLRVDDMFNVNLQFVEATGKILCFVEIATLADHTPKEVYRDLLAGALFGRDTAGGYFALEETSNIVVYNYFFDFEDASADIDRFISTLEKILQLCEMWADRIAEKSEAHATDESDHVAESFDDGVHRDSHFHFIQP